ncbi:MAG: tRNA (adenosine(37)-N6)-threonylcarbamoyltransferase complex ATPase subunit type 1 TsaE [Clostridia bacterium]|nr:tRNA (adenosine(37)-N6)-threonylcarbamoyltransferase complex ATPase subunit type 1 TsaE [Clostridia bacterium]MBP3650067.1 tRNA (adenosine(37)-N6)-threonylcarbamoyltransferase complex ATPase subunit type 1 TsaE [Clostridia bacterium]
MRFISHSVAQTQQVGSILAGQLQPGDVLLMLGNMGVGKSEFTRGLARGLGVTGYVTSPTFTILQVHDEGRMPLYHFDWYRLSDVEELYELSMDEYLYGDGVSVIEWPSKAEEAIPASYLQVELIPVGDEERVIELTPVGDFHILDEAQMRKEGAMPA